MDHAEAVERIELATSEPGGLERLMSGDTPEGAAVAGHLAGCPACVDELARIDRTAGIVRGIVATAPDPALRERTLAFVREVGRSRAGALPPVSAGSSGSSPDATRRRWLQVGAIAAALVLVAGLGFGIAAMRSREPQLERQVTILESAAREAVRVGAQPDAIRVALVATPAAPGASGNLVMSPSMGRVVMVAEGLPALGPGEEYGCWIQADGTRTRIGRMYPGGGLQAWAGPVGGLDEVPADAVFGVSLVRADAGPGVPVLVSGVQ